MIGTIQAVKRSQSQKTLSVQVDGAWYSSKNWEWETDPRIVGKRIIFEPSVQVFLGGGSCTWLNDYVFEEGGTTPADQAMSQAMAGRHGLNEQGYPEGSAAPMASKPNKDSVIGAMGLCKCCTPGTPEQVFENFQLLYHKLENWDSSVPF